MEDLDDKIAAKLAAKKKIKGKKKRRPADDERENEDVVVGQLKSPPELQLSNQLLSSISAKPSVEGKDSKDSSFEEDSKIAAVPVVAVAASSKKPGAYAAKSTDVSAAERLKFGTTTATPTEVQPSSRPGAYSATTEDVSAAERLKFGIVTSATVVGSVPGAYATSNEDTSAAERLKFGVAVPVTNDAPVAVGGFDPNTSEYSNSSLTNDFWAGSRQHTSRNENAVVEAEVVSEHSSEDNDYSSGESYDEDIDSTRWRARRWRNMFIVSSVVLVIIIIGLSVALASATKPPSPNTTPVIIDEGESVSQKQPTSFPSMSPSLRPVDISWCFTDLEYLENYRYSSLRSALVNSGLSSDDEFSSNDSYQRKALCWLVFGDGLQLDKGDPFLEQRYALATLFYSQNEPIKLRSSGWLSNKHECNWTPMVQCDIRTGSTVSKLNITNFNLEGKLPKELRSLQFVTHLDASQNLLDGGIAEATSGWIDLQQLRLANNRLEAVPQVLGAMSSMTHLDVSGNNISGDIPDFLAFMNNLIHLDISSNSFNGTIPDYMGDNLPNLSSLYMHSNQLTGNIPQSICNLRQRSLSHLSVDCGVGREIQCDVPLCCTACNGYDF